MADGKKWWDEGERHTNMKRHKVDTVTRLPTETKDFHLLLLIKINKTGGFSLAILDGLLNCFVFIAAHLRGLYQLVLPTRRWQSVDGG